MFGKDIQPSKNPTDDILTVHDDRTLSYVGYAGHLAFHKAAETAFEGKLVRVDYEKYRAGMDEFTF